MNVAGIEIKRGGLVNSFRVVISVKLLRRFVFLQNQLLNSKFERIFIRCNTIFLDTLVRTHSSARYRTIFEFSDKVFGMFILENLKFNLLLLSSRTYRVTNFGF